MKKKSKAEKITDMLLAGESVAVIKRMLGASESYVYLLKKKMEADWGIPKTKEAFPDFINMVSQGKEKEPTVKTSKPEEFVQADTNVDAILNERATDYGIFIGNARVTQRLKSVAHQFASDQNKTFDADQAEALDMIFTKIGRILNGDPNYVDSWTDIAGYATLVADRLQGKTR